MISTGPDNVLQPAPAAAPTVLVVEDERISREALTHLLDHSGFHATACGSAEEALETLAEMPAPVVALVDVDLPGMSGLDFVARLEQLRPGLPAVLITAAGGDRISRFREQHDVGYIRKPLDFGHLLKLLGHRREARFNTPQGNPAPNRDLS